MSSTEQEILISSIVKIKQVKINGKPSSYANGIILHSNVMTVLTMAHVARKKVNQEIYVTIKEMEYRVSQRICKFKFDLALCYLQDQPACGIKLTRPCLIENDSVFCVGHDYTKNGQGITLAEHKIEALQDDYIITSGYAARGMSGSPLLNEAGEVLGLLSTANKENAVFISINAILRELPEMQQKIVRN